MHPSMGEDCKYVSRIICGEYREGLVHGVHCLKPMSLFDDELAEAKGYKPPVPKCELS